MTEEKNIDSGRQIVDSGKRYPEPTAGGIIYNDNGETLLVRCPKWGDYWHVPGGHVELGETCEQALKREVKEETGLEIDQIEFLGWQDAIEPKEFHKKKHFIYLDFCARMAGGKLTKSDEMTEYRWILPAEALKTLKIDSGTIRTIQLYLDHLENKKENLTDKYKRALADYQNLLKQTAKEKMEFAIYANEQMLREILPVYSHLKMALEHAENTPNNAKEITKGVAHVVKQFKDALEKLGVEEIKVEGQDFDHNTMEAISSEETEDKKSDGKVARVMKAGYTLNGKVIEAARVVVYRAK
jgi:nucleoside triphosphatase